MTTLAKGTERKGSSMSTTEDRIEALWAKISKGEISRDETLRELDELKRAFDSRNLSGTGNYTGKIAEAHGWADIYFSDRKSNKYAIGHVSGRERVKGFLLNDLSTAAQIASQLDRGG